MIVAIDGPAGSGKSTVAKQVARDLNFFFLNSGACYRAVALSFLAQHNISPNTNDASFVARIRTLCDEVSDETLLAIARELKPSLVDNKLQLFGEPLAPEIYAEAVGETASRISSSVALRACINEELRELAHNIDLVAEGRDTGTDMFPEAEVKIFLTASLEERARRRGDQEQELEEVRGASDEDARLQLAKRMQERDERDAQRAVGALRVAKDAHMIDSTGLTVRQVCEKIATYIRLQKSYRK